jgi:hypothetical protein
MEEKNCAFQYAAEKWSGMEVVEDKTGITLTEAKALFNKYYPQMVAISEQGERIEVAIWVNMAHESDYNETLIHLNSPEVKDGYLTERQYFSPFKINTPNGTKQKQ